LRELVARGIAPWARVVEAVRELGRIDAQGTGIEHDFAGARDAAVRMLDKGLVLEASLEALRAAVAAVTCGPAEELGTVHGDLHDKQVFFGPDAAMLIDLESMGHGDPRFDQANLAEHLRLRSLQQSGADDGVGAHVLDQLGFAPGPDRNAHLAVVRARLCGVYALRPRWKSLVHRLRDETLSLIESCR
jgi:aminoglycoside phosphotransferase (APT) family kinase protein